MSRHGRADFGTDRPDSVRARETALDGESVRIAGTPSVSELEPISPELVLVDPELARRLIGGLSERARPRSVGHAAALTRVPERRRLPRERMEEPPATCGLRESLHEAGRRVVSVLLAAGLFVTGLLTATVVSRSLDERPGQALSRSTLRSPVLAVPTAQGRSGGSPAEGTRPPPLTPADPTAHRHSTKTAPARARPARSSTATSPRSTQGPKNPRTPPSKILGENSAMVERKVLALVVQSPAGKLPAALIEGRTGLAKNNLQAVCRLRQRSSFLCVIRPARHKPN